MIHVQLKLKLKPIQERQLRRWLWHLTGVWNWAVRKIELDARNGIYRTAKDFSYFLKGHSFRMGIPVDVMAGVTDTAAQSWGRCFKRISGKPKLKGRRNQMNSIPLKRAITRPTGRRINVMGLQGLKFHKQDIPEGRIRCGRIIRRASGWGEKWPDWLRRTVSKAVGVSDLWRRARSGRERGPEHPHCCARIARRVA